MARLIVALHGFAQRCSSPAFAAAVQITLPNPTPTPYSNAWGMTLCGCCTVVLEGPCYLVVLVSQQAVPDAKLVSPPKSNAPNLGMPSCPCL
jgi:hypothetical protein